MSALARHWLRRVLLLRIHNEPSSRGKPARQVNRYPLSDTIPLKNFRMTASWSWPINKASFRSYCTATKKRFRKRKNPAETDFKKIPNRLIAGPESVS